MLLARAAVPTEQDDGDAALVEAALLDGAADDPGLEGGQEVGGRVLALDQLGDVAGGGGCREHHGEEGGEGEDLLGMHFEWLLLLLDGNTTLGVSES